MSGLLKGLAKRVNRRRLMDEADPDHLQLENRHGFMTEALNIRDAVPEKARFDTDFIHLSSLIDLCPRKYVLAATGAVEIRQSVTGAYKVMWRIGRGVEEHVRSEFIASVGYRNVIGNWTCLCGGKLITGTAALDAPACQKCGTYPSIYQELPLYDMEAKVVGNPDMLYRGSDGRVHVVEIKSMNAKDFAKLTRPLGNHVFQATGYRKLAQINGFDVCDSVTIFYVNKGFSWGEYYKEFRVAVEPPHEGLLEEAWSQARSIRDALRLRTLPGREMCGTETCSRAKQCPCVTQCFGLDG